MELPPFPDDLPEAKQVEMVMGVLGTFLNQAHIPFEITTMALTNLLISAFIGVRHLAVVHSDAIDDALVIDAMKKTAERLVLLADTPIEQLQAVADFHRDVQDEPQA